MGQDDLKFLGEENPTARVCYTGVTSCPQVRCLGNILKAK